MKTVAILQSNYIPWKGYFDIIGMVDEFIIYDEVQFTKNDWRNRNRIKTRNGLEWLSIPVRHKSLDQTIAETVVADDRWSVKHWKSIENSYAKAPCFSHYAPEIQRLYERAANLTLLSEINVLFIREICALLKIETLITSSSQYTLAGDRVDRLVNICHQANADAYLSGPAAMDYIDTNAFEDRGIRLEWMEYGGYPEYPQLFPPFQHGVSILDLMFCAGSEARKYLKAR